MLIDFAEVKKGNRFSMTLCKLVEGLKLTEKMLPFFTIQHLYRDISPIYLLMKVRSFNGINEGKHETKNR